MIRAGGTAALLAHIFYRTGRAPDEIWNKPPGARAFCLAAARWWLSGESGQAQG